jgi:hypothetical protein
VTEDGKTATTQTLAEKQENKMNAADGRWLMATYYPQSFRSGSSENHGSKVKAKRMLIAEVACLWILLQRDK